MQRDGIGNLGDLPRFAAGGTHFIPTTLVETERRRRFDDAFLDDLPTTVDPCGEHGQFHTFVYDGPSFAAPVDVTLGEVVTRDGFVFQDPQEVSLNPVL